MAGITAAQAQEQLDAYLAASLAVSRGQAYQIGTRSFRRTDAAEIQKAITYWNSMVVQLTPGGGPKVRRFTPLDR